MAGSALGGYLGGGPIGTAIGGALGSLAGAGIGKLFGRGDYKIRKNAFMDHQGALKRSSIPEFGGSDGKVVVTRTTYVGTVFVPAPEEGAGSPFTTRSFALNPRNEVLFPWLAGIANCYKEFEWLGLVATFKSTYGTAVSSTSAALGAVGMSTQYDPLAPTYSSRRDCENAAYATSGTTCQTQIHAIECARGSDPLDVMYTDTDGDARFESLGNLVLWTEGQQAEDIIGELWISYKCKLSLPTLPTSGIVNAKFGHFAGIPSVDGFPFLESLGAHTGGSPEIYITETNEIAVLEPAIEARNYLTFTTRGRFVLVCTYDGTGNTTVVMDAHVSLRVTMVEILANHTKSSFSVADGTAQITVVFVIDVEPELHAPAYFAPGDLHYGISVPKWAEVIVTQLPYTLEKPPDAKSVMMEEICARLGITPPTEPRERAPRMNTTVIHKSLRHETPPRAEQKGAPPTQGGPRSTTAPPALPSCAPQGQLYSLNPITGELVAAGLVSGMSTPCVVDPQQGFGGALISHCNDDGPYTDVEVAFPPADQPDSEEYKYYDLHRSTGALQPTNRLYPRHRRTQPIRIPHTLGCSRHSCKLGKEYSCCEAGDGPGEEKTYFQPPSDFVNDVLIELQGRLVTRASTHSLLQTHNEVRALCLATLAKLEAIERRELRVWRGMLAQRAANMDNNHQTTSYCTQARDIEECHIGAPTGQGQHAARRHVHLGLSDRPEFSYHYTRPRSQWERDPAVHNLGKEIGKEFSSCTDGDGPPKKGGNKKPPETQKSKFRANRANIKAGLKTERKQPIKTDFIAHFAMADVNRDVSNQGKRPPLIKRGLALCADGSCSHGGACRRKAHLTKRLEEPLTGRNRRIRQDLQKGKPKSERAEPITPLWTPCHSPEGHHWSVAECQALDCVYHSHDVSEPLSYSTHSELELKERAASQADASNLKSKAHDTKTSGIAQTPSPTNARVPAIGGEEEEAAVQIIEPSVAPVSPDWESPLELPTMLTTPPSEAKVLDVLTIPTKSTKPAPSRPPSPTNTHVPALGGEEKEDHDTKDKDEGVGPANPTEVMSRVDSETKEWLYNRKYAKDMAAMNKVLERAREDAAPRPITMDTVMDLLKGRKAVYFTKHKPTTPEVHEPLPLKPEKPLKPWEPGDEPRTSKSILFELTDAGSRKHPVGWTSRVIQQIQRAATTILATDQGKMDMALSNLTKLKTKGKGHQMYFEPPTDGAWNKDKRDIYDKRVGIPHYYSILGWRYNGESFETSETTNTVFGQKYDSARACTIFTELVQTMQASQSLLSIKCLDFKKGVPHYRTSFLASVKSQMQHDKKLSVYAAACLAHDAAFYGDTMATYAQQRYVASMLDQRSVPTGLEGATVVETR